MSETTEQLHQTALQAAKEYGGLKVEVKSLADGLRELKQDNRELLQKFSDACLKLGSIDDAVKRLLHYKVDSEKRIDSLEKQVTDLVRSITNLRDMQQEHQSDHCEDCRNEKRIAEAARRSFELARSFAEMTAAVSAMQDKIKAVEEVPPALKEVRAIIQSASFLGIMRILNTKVPKFGRIVTILFWLLIANLVMSFYIHRDFAIETLDTIKSHF